jgi:hypothetical protein
MCVLRAGYLRAISLLLKNGVEIGDNEELSEAPTWNESYITP